MTTVALTMRGAGVEIAGRCLLGPLDLQIEAPGITAIMGPNGAGKSLFLKLAHGLLAGAGAVRWGGKPAASSLPSRGFVFQHPPLLRRSVAANLGFPLVAAGVARRARRAQVAQALVGARLSHAAQQPAARLSGGERQRLALARALITGPQALLLDEPSASLDPAATEVLEQVIRAAADRGVKVLIATHDLGQTRRLADDLVFLADGQIVAQGPAAPLLQDPPHPAMRAYVEGRLV